MAEKAIMVLAVRPGERPVLEVLDGSLEAMQEMVGGHLEQMMPFEDEVAIVCNDEGKLYGLPLNRAMYDRHGEMFDIIAGPFFVCYAPADSERYMSLPEELVHKYADLFEAPEQFSRDAAGLLVRRDVEKVSQYLGVHYQMHRFKNGVDIEFTDKNGETLEWHTVEQGSEECSNLEAVAKERAGNLAIQLAKAALAKEDVSATLFAGLAAYCECVRYDEYLDVLGAGQAETDVVGMVKERLTDEMVAAAVSSSLKEFCEEGPVGEEELAFLNGIIEELRGVASDDKALGDVLKRRNLSFDDLGLCIGFQDGSVGRTNDFYHHLLGEVVAAQKNLDELIAGAIEKYQNETSENMVIDILQLRRGDDMRFLRFAHLDWLDNGVDSVECKNYEHVYRYADEDLVDMDDEDAVMDLLEKVSARFNVRHPEDFRGHSLSTSDVVVLNGAKAFYCDWIGFETLPEKFVEDFQKSFGREIEGEELEF